MFRTILIASAITTMYAQPSLARKPVECTDKVTAMVNVNIRDRAPTLKEAKDVFDKQMGQMESLSKQAGIDELNIKSMNYNINPNQNYDGYGGKAMVNYYQISGNINIQLTDEGQALRFAEFLEKQGIVASLNMNSYKQGNCQ